MSRWIESSTKSYISQARDYSACAGIELRPSQIKEYVELRTSSEFKFKTDDHHLLDTILDDNQRVPFRAKYEFIFGETPQD